MSKAMRKIKSATTSRRKCGIGVRLREIKIPDVAIDQCDHERGAQKNGGSADVVAPTSVYAIGGNRGVEGERKGEELI
jgi:hypothetical protein